MPESIKVILRQSLDEVLKNKAEETLSMDVGAEVLSVEDELDYFAFFAKLIFQAADEAKAQIEAINAYLHENNVSWEEKGDDDIEMDEEDESKEEVGDEDNLSYQVVKTQVQRSKEVEELRLKYYNLTVKTIDRLFGYKEDKDKLKNYE